MTPSHSMRPLAIVLAMLALVFCARRRPRRPPSSSPPRPAIASRPSRPRSFQPQAQDGGAAFQIDPATKHQTIVGFGASILEAGMICINSLPADQQEQVLQAIFDPDRGAGYSAMKTTIACTDFMSAGPWYTYNDTPDNIAMKNFSIERDLKPDGSATFIKRARKYGNFVLQAPMDYPPDWMLAEVSDRKKQDVQEKCFDALARYYLRYLQEYQKQGIFIDYLCLFNEPGIYTKIPYTKIRNLIKNHVGPLLAREGIKTKIMLSEAENRGRAFREYPTVLDDPEARNTSRPCHTTATAPATTTRSPRCTPAIRTCRCG